MQQFSCAPQLIPSGHLRVLCPEVSTYGGMRVCVPRSLLALLPYTNANMRGARYLPSIHLISQPAAMPNEMPLQRCDDGAKRLPGGSAFISCKTVTEETQCCVLPVLQPFISSHLTVSYSFTCQKQAHYTT